MSRALRAALTCTLAAALLVSCGSTSPPRAERPVSPAAGTGLFRALTFADDRTGTARWADLGIEAQTFAGLPVDALEVVDHGAEVPLSYECARN